MQKLFVSITAATVLVHSVLGCCAHAVQSGGACDHEHATCAGHAEHSHSHDVTASKPAEKHSPAKDHGCCRLKCQWLAPSAPFDLSTTLLSHAAIFDADQVPVSLAATAWSSESPLYGCPPALTLRSHLALGVLLI